MLILKPVNGVWWVVSSGYPDGAWCGFTNPDAALAVVQWMTELKLDCDGILARLHFGKLTPADRKTVARINYCTRHPSRVVSSKEPIEQRIIRSRLKMTKPLSN